MTILSSPHRSIRRRAPLRLALSALMCAAACAPRAMAAQAAARRVSVDTVALALDDLERRFLDRNLQLLAARLNVSAAHAVTEQARLWPNPNISVEQGAYDQASGALFDATRTGSTDIAFNQLVQLAGKRGKQIQVATATGVVAERTFDELLRSLRFQLRSDFHSLRFLQRAIAFDDRAIAAARLTIASAERMYESRAILLSEVVRLRALLLSLESERLGLRSRLADMQGNLRVLLRDEGPERWYVASEDEAAAARVDAQPVEALVARAVADRSDVRLAAAAARVDSANLQLQRALAVPDLSIGARYSHSGAYVPDYVGLAVSVDLPFFNRNQGNIKAAAYTLAADQRLAEAARAKAEGEVLVAYRKAAEADAVWRGTDRRFADEYDRLLVGTTANYEARNISIIQFTDFFDSWRQTMQQLTQLEQTRADAIEALNFAVGAVVVRP